MTARLGCRRCPPRAPSCSTATPATTTRSPSCSPPGRPDAIDLRAVTTVGGNAELEKVTLNARRVLTLAGVTDVPVAAGAAGPRRGDLMTALDVHGESGLDGAELPEPAMELDPRGAVELMVDRGPATVVATGPLTNVAALLERSPETVREIVWMGGSTARGNTRPYAEFNALVDPEAAEIVFASGKPLTMVGLNLTHQAQATPGGRRAPARRRQRGGGGDDRLAVVLRRHLPHGLRLRRAAGARRVRGGAAHRSLARAQRRDLRRPSRPRGAGRAGATAVDLHGRLGMAPNARVAMELDVDGFWDLVIGAIAAL